MGNVHSVFHWLSVSFYDTRHSFLRFAPSFSRTGANAPLAVRPTCQLTHHWRNKSAALRFKCHLCKDLALDLWECILILTNRVNICPCSPLPPPPQCCCLISADYHCPSGPPVLSGHNPLSSPTFPLPLCSSTVGIPCLSLCPFTSSSSSSHFSFVSGTFHPRPRSNPTFASPLPAALIIGVLSVCCPSSSSLCRFEPDYCEGEDREEEEWISVAYTSTIHILFIRSYLGWIIFCSEVNGLQEQTKDLFVFWHLQNI